MTLYYVQKGHSPYSYKRTMLNLNVNTIQYFHKGYTISTKNQYNWLTLYDFSSSFFSLFKKEEEEELRVNAHYSAVLFDYSEWNWVWGRSASSDPDASLFLSLYIQSMPIKHMRITSVSLIPIYIYIILVYTSSS